jgi:hypothetical protein
VFNERAGNFKFDGVLTVAAVPTNIKLSTEPCSSILSIFHEGKLNLRRLQGIAWSGQE